MKVDIKDWTPIVLIAITLLALEMHGIDTLCPESKYIIGTRRHFEFLI